MTSNKKEIWINAISTNGIKRAWDLRRALKSRTIASAIVLSGDYETKVLIESDQRQRLKNILNSHDHKMVVNNVKRPNFSESHCGWEVADGYFITTTVKVVKNYRQFKINILILNISIHM